MSFDDLIKFGVLLGKTLLDESQVRNVHDTDDYNDELNTNIEELDLKDDIELLVDFHKEYTDHWSQGLFQMDTANRMDPMFMAYMKVFDSRNIIKLEVCCKECEKVLGYRMAPKVFDVIENEYELCNGSCSCNCGKSNRWQICRNWGDEPAIWTYNF